MKGSLKTGDKRATISDVARLADVSIKTVSRVANGEASVRETTRSRVQKAIDTLGYQANPYARYLSLLRSQSAATSSRHPADEATG